MLPYREIDIETYRAEFEEPKQNYLLVDVREIDEYEAGRIPGAINLPLSQFQMRTGEIDSEKTVILVCASGGRSGLAAEYLATIGYDDLYNLVDGTMGWMMRGLPLER